MRGLYPSYCAALILLGAADVARAGDENGPKTENCAPKGFDQRLAVRYSASATGDLPCIANNDWLAKELANWTDQIRENAASFSLRLRLVRGELTRLGSGLSVPELDSDPVLASKARTLKDALDEAVKEIDGLAQSSSNSPSDVSKYPALAVDSWKVDGTPSRGPGGLPVVYLKEKGCLGSSPPAACEEAYKGAVALGDRIFYVDTLVSLVNSSDRGKLLDEAKSREDRWHSYLYDTQFQYWWELGLNRLVDQTCPAWMRWDCTKIQTDPLGNELGFRTPPNQKLILLHPDIGVEYLHGEPSGQRFKAVIVFQWFGFQHWTWQDNKAGSLLGVSLISTVADTSVSSRVGTGLQFQWEKYSLAVTLRSREVGIAINLGLIDRLGTVNQNWANQLKAPLGQ